MALLLWGGTLVSAPQASGGPMNFDPSNPGGAALLVLGMALLPDPGTPQQRLPWVLGGLFSAVPVLGHVWWFPPFLDGQAYASYIGTPDPDLWPAMAGFTAFGMVPLTLALAAIPPRGAPAATKRSLLLWAGPAAGLFCCGFAAFNGALWWLADSRMVRRALLATCVTVAMLSLRLRHRTGARVAGACALLSLGLYGVMLVLEAA